MLNQGENRYHSYQQHNTYHYHDNREVSHVQKEEENHLSECIKCPQSLNTQQNSIERTSPPL